MANEISMQDKKELTFSDYIVNELVRIEDALPKSLNKARFAQNAVALLQEKPELVQKYGTEKVMAGLLKGAVMDLDFYKKECYLIPYGNQLNFQPDYKGKMKIVKKYSPRPIKDIDAGIVREDDFIEISNDSGVGKFSFKPVPFSKKPILGAFAYILYADGDTKVELIDIEQLEAIKQQSKAQNSGAWKNFTTEMYKKCAINRIAKKIDLDFENDAQRDAFFEDTAIETDVEKVVENEVKENANSKSFDIEVDATESE